jgi:hypothetical protein
VEAESSWCCSRSGDAGLKATANDPFAIRAEDHARDFVSVSFEGEDLLTGLRIPDLEGLVPAPTHNPFAVGAEGHTQDTVGVPFEGAGFLPGLRIPELERPPRISLSTLVSVRSPCSTALQLHEAIKDSFSTSKRQEAHPRSRRRCHANHQ